MRYRPDQKAKAKTMILQAGASAFKTCGFDGIGVDGVAAAAGVTSGAFYSNFASKAALLEAIVERAEDDPSIDTDIGSPAGRTERLRGWLAAYLDPGHRDDVGRGCLLPALSADVARADPAVKRAYERRVQHLVGWIAKALDGTEADREQSAWSIVALLIGALSVSRALPDAAQARHVLDAALRTALQIADRSSSPPELAAGSTRSCAAPDLPPLEVSHR